MKHIKRVFTMLLAMVLLFSGVVEPLSLTAQAAAENVPTLGSNNVGNTPDELLSLGEWQYWIENGVATIAGYTNTAEAELSIPDKLGGCPVTGIGNHAFSENDGLVSIYIPTNVTRIADDAFDGLYRISIRAYHGAFALVFANNHGLVASEIEQPGVEFVNGVLDLRGLPSGSFSNLNDFDVIFISNQATFLDVGQIVMFPPNADYPTGLARRIESITEEGNRLFVSLSEPEWGECFERVTGEEELTLDWDNAIFYNGFTLDENSVQPAGAASVNGKATIGVKDFEFGPKKKIKYSGSLSVELEIAASWDIGRKGLTVQAKELEIVTKVTTTESGKLKIKGDENQRVGKREQVYHELAAVTVPVVGAGAVNGYITVDILFEVSGEMEWKTTASTTWTTSYKNGKVTTQKDTKPGQKSFSLTAEFKCGPEVKFYLVLGWAGFSIRFFEVSAGLYFKATGQETWTWILKGTESWHNCSDASITIEFTVECKIGLIQIARTHLNAYVSCSFTLGPWTIMSGHWDNGIFAESCSLKNRKAEIFIDDRNKTVVTYNVNSSLTEPDKPLKSGYKFNGWYVNTSSSGLQGADYKFNFASDTMPYCGADGTFYLYAKYTKIQHPVTAITLSQTNVTAFTNNTAGVRLTATITPANADEAIAIVNSNGQITGVANGNVWIRATAEDGSGIYGRTRIKVGIAPPIPVTNIVLDKTAFSLYTNDKKGVQLTATVSPADADDPSITWQTSNSKVATVDNNGLVKVHSAGTAVITCRSVSNPGVEKTCAVTVKQYMDQLYPTVATVSSSGVVQGLAPGNATISCAATDGSEVSAYCLIKVESLLQLDESRLSYTVYANGEDHVDLDTVNITLDSSKRLIANGLNTTWTLSRLSGDSAELGVEEYRAQAEEDVSVSGVKIKLLRMHHVGTDILMSAAAI